MCDSWLCRRFLPGTLVLRPTFDAAIDPPDALLWISGGDAKTADWNQRKELSINLKTLSSC
jgi:hypothetical protein